MILNILPQFFICAGFISSACGFIYLYIQNLELKKELERTRSEFTQILLKENTSQLGVEPLIDKSSIGELSDALFFQGAFHTCLLFCCICGLSYLYLTLPTTYQVDSIVEKHISTIDSNLENVVTNVIDKKINDLLVHPNDTFVDYLNNNVSGGFTHLGASLITNEALTDTLSSSTVVITSN